MPSCAVRCVPVWSQSRLQWRADGIQSHPSPSDSPETGTQTYPTQIASCRPFSSRQATGMGGCASGTQAQAPTWRPGKPRWPGAGSSPRPGMTRQVSLSWDSPGSRRGRVSWPSSWLLAASPCGTPEVGHGEGGAGWGLCERWEVRRGAVESLVYIFAFQRANGSVAMPARRSAIP